MILHIINQSPTASDTLGLCLSVADKNTGILLIEDGVYANQTMIFDSATKKGVTFYLLKADMQARGIQPVPELNVVDYEGFVDLVCQYQATQTWL